MDKDEFIKIISNISKEIRANKNVNFEYRLGPTKYKIMINKPEPNKGINIASIIAIPQGNNTKNEIILESNNLETSNLESLLEQGIQTSMKLANLTNNKPGVIVVPLIPSYKDSPYFQQLSKECFELPKENPNYRIDEQVIKIINKAKDIVKTEKGIDLNDKIFLNGYSSSGVFAQRFSLLHPELIEKACIGGASGSIPIPTKALGYPIGIEDYKSITGKEFDMENYKKINFKYYVGELETQNKSNTRTDEKGNPAPMHDMSYFNRSVPKEVGIKQRNKLGIDMLERANNTIAILKNLGLNIEHIIIKGRAHNNRNGSIGVNEKGDKIINNLYNEPIKEDKEEILR